FEIYGNDLIVATHGRGFWVIDDISPLRQLNDAVLQAEAHLFKPAAAINVLQGGDNGTPLQKDEPQASNPPNGAILDYYLKAASGPVTLEIQDATGAALSGGIPNTTALWRPTPEPFSGAPGMHRVVWIPVAAGVGGGGGGGGVGGGFGRGGGARLTGSFTAILTVNGKSYRQGFVVKADPRVRG